MNIVIISNLCRTDSTGTSTGSSNFILIYVDDAVVGVLVSRPSHLFCPWLFWYRIIVIIVIIVFRAATT